MSWARVENESRVGLGNESHQLVDGERDDAEHEMAHDFAVTAYTHRSAAELVLDSSVDTLNGGALVVADLLGQAVAEASAPFFLRL